MAAFIQIPQHGGPVLASRSTQRAVRGHRNTVHVASMPKQVCADFAVIQVPHFHDLVPTSADDERRGEVRREADAGNPLFMAVLHDGKLELPQCVPQIYGFVSRT